MKLSELSTGQTAVVVKVHGHGAFRKRVMEMGFVKGHAVKVVLHAPLQDPINYSIMGYEISLRASEASMIDVVPVDGAELSAMTHFAECVTPSEGENLKAHKDFHHRSHHITVALIGNPNCGKTSLFNAASGAKEHVGNYSGVTVDAKGETFRYGDYTFSIVDLPGT